MTKALGTFLDRVRLPSVLGGVFSGIIIGLFAVLLRGQDINILSGIENPSFKVLAEIGIIFLLFMSGMEVDTGDMKKSGKTAVLAAIGGVAVPFAFGLSFGLLNPGHYSLKASLVLASILTATSVGITARTLIDIGAIKRRSSTVILSAAVIDDVMGIVVLTVVMGTMSIGDLALRIAVFFFIAAFIGLKMVGRIMGMGERLKMSKSLVSVSIALCFFYSAFAQEMGIAAITGAFLAGVLVGNTIQARRIRGDIETLATAFFVPLFFVSVGSSFEIEYFGEIGLGAAAFIVVAMSGKVIGSGLGAKAGGMTWRESLQVGVGMMARLEVALVIAAVAISQPGVLTPEEGHRILTLTVLLVIVSTIVTPIATKWAFGKRDEGMYPE